MFVHVDEKQILQFVFRCLNGIAGLKWSDRVRKRNAPEDESNKSARTAENADSRKQGFSVTTPGLIGNSEKTGVLCHD